MGIDVERIGLPLATRYTLDFEKVVRELRQEFRSAFELALANQIWSARARLDSVHLVSANMIKILKTHRMESEALLENDPAIRRDLFSPSVFGRLSPIEGESSADLLDRMLRLLADPDTSLDSVMQLHSVIGYRFLKKFEDLDQSTLESIQTGASPALRDRGRIETSRSAKPERTTAVLGFHSTPYFRQKAGRLDYAWEHGADLHKKDPESLFVQSLEAFSIPFVSGPSGHTLSLLAAAKAFAGLDLSTATIEYTLACLSFLVRGGHHSTHEVMLIAKRLGTPYETGRYAPSIPMLLQAKLGLTALLNEYAP